MKSYIIIIITFLAINASWAQSTPFEQGAYFNFHGGGGPLANDGGFILGYHLNGGYQWSPYVGIGAGIGAYIGVDYFISGFTGISMQYRIRPSEKWIASLDYGLILNHEQGNDIIYWEYIPDLYPFVKAHLARKVSNRLTLGLAFAGLPKVKYEECNTSSGGNCTSFYTNTYKWSPAGFLLTLGVTIE